MKVKSIKSVFDFDQKVLEDSLKNELNLQSKDTKEVSKEVVKRVESSEVDFIDTQLIRAVTTSVLLEKGLIDQAKDYVGLTLSSKEVNLIYDRKPFFWKETAVQHYFNPQQLKTMVGEVMLEKQTLKILPEELQEAHLNGDIFIHHIHDFATHVDSIKHDLGVLFKHGFAVPYSNFSGPPKKSSSAVMQLAPILNETQDYVSSGQVVDSMNTYLSPFVVGTSFSEQKQLAQSILYEFSQGILSGNTFPLITLCFDIGLPEELQKQEVTSSTTYEDYYFESQNLLKAFLRVLSEKDYFGKCFYQPQIELKINDLKQADEIFGEASSIVSSQAILYFTGSKPYLADGTGFRSNGNLQRVSLNLPRLAYDSNGSDKTFLSALEEQMELARQTLEIKKNLVATMIDKGYYSFLIQSFEGKKYCDPTNFSKIIGFVGLNEACKVHTGSYIHETNESLKFAKKVLKHMNSKAKKFGGSYEVAQTTNNLVARRLAEKDLTSFGESVTLVNKTYSSTSFLKDDAHIPVSEKIGLESDLRSLVSSGLLDLRLSSDKPSEQSIINLIKDVKKSKVGLFTFSQPHSVCLKCKKAFIGKLAVCPNCGEESMQFYSREGGIYQWVEEEVPHHKYNP